MDFADRLNDLAQKQEEITDPHSSPKSISDLEEGR